jgi:hypothetical protein
VLGGASTNSIRVYGDDPGSTAITGALPLTVTSGNEITDGLRAAQGPVDGFFPGQGGGVGTWPAHSNKAPNTTFAAAGPPPTGWGQSAATVTQDSRSDCPFPGHYVAKVASTGAGGEIYLTQSYSPAASSGQTWGASVWVLGTAGRQITLTLIGKNGSFADTERVDVTVTCTGSWQRIAATVALANAATVALTVGVYATAGTTDIFWVAAPMLALSTNPLDQLDFPYIANPATTIGSSATRASSRITAPASLLDVTQGWAAALVMPSYSSAHIGSAGRYIFGWETDSQNSIAAGIGPGAQAFARNYAASVATDAVKSTSAWSAYQPILVVMAWDATKVYASVGGSPFVSASPTPRTLPSGTVFGIGSLVGGSFLAGNVRWFAAGAGMPSSADLTALAGISGVPSFSALPASPTMLWSGIDTNYVETLSGQMNTDTYADGAASSFGAAEPLDYDMSIFGTYIAAQQVLPDEDDLYYARLPFDRAQAALDTAKTDPASLRAANLSWHGDLTDPERGSFALVNRGGPLDDLVGDRVQIIVGRGTDVQRRVVAYCHADADLISDISVTRRLFLALGILGDEQPTVEVEVLV